LQARTHTGTNECVEGPCRIKPAASTNVRDGGPLPRKPNVLGKILHTLQALQLVTCFEPRCQESTWWCRDKLHRLRVKPCSVAAHLLLVRSHSDHSRALPTYCQHPTASMLHSSDCGAQCSRHRCENFCKQGVKCILCGVQYCSSDCQRQDAYVGHGSCTLRAIQLRIEEGPLDEAWCTKVSADGNYALPAIRASAVLIRSLACCGEIVASALYISIYEIQSRLRQRNLTDKRISLVASCERLRQQHPLDSICCSHVKQYGCIGDGIAPRAPHSLL
jgi:hypothetical protein